MRLKHFVDGVEKGYPPTRNGKCPLMKSFGLCPLTVCTEEINIFPHGERPFRANCFDDCGVNLACDRWAQLKHGRDHAPTGITRQGVNGLFDMGANVWEWVNTADQVNKGTLGGSW